MSAALAQKRKITPEEYLVLERQSEERHEYFNGEIFPMPGGSREHNLIAGNIYMSLRMSLRDQVAEVFTSDMKVRIPATGLYTYPDVSAVLGEPVFEEQERDVLVNPTVLVEVLSPSTEAYDRGKKFDNYCSLPSLCDYVLVAQDERIVEHYTRHEDGAWLLRKLRAGDALRLATLGIEVPLAEIYLKVFTS